MILINRCDFNKNYENGLKYIDFVNDAEKEDHIKKYNLYYKRAVLPKYISEFFSGMTYDVKAIIVSAHWCFDCQVTLPIIEKLREASQGKFDYRLFKKEKHMQLLDPTNGGEKIPYVILFSQDGYLIDRWIERPTIIYEYYGELRRKIGWETKDFYREYRKGYLQKYSEFNNAIVSDLLDKFKRANAIMSTSPRINNSLQMSIPLG
ncbi:MAG: hypothetical protein HeimC3_18990 [Candidatus Heimdallarchaeota archaeon LC_3]|nr:MAG: hypothetical protein HeimC3_18990 [Candidatus Heimdallarchaeota archaeon LC_3]